MKSKIISTGIGLMGLFWAGCRSDPPSQTPISQVPASEPTLDSPQSGGTSDRNMVSPDKGLPMVFDPGLIRYGSEEVDLSTTMNCLWIAKLGSQTNRPPAVGGGKVLIGTNNEWPRDERHQGDRGILLCLDEKTGTFLWQLVVPKLPAGKVNDWEFLGICSTAAITGDRAYVITNRCEVVCLDMNGFVDGNQGIQDEAIYMAEPGQPPVELGPTDADIIWVFDMREELGVFPHNKAGSSVTVIGDKILATTSNGVDWTHQNIPSPQAPSLIMLSADTGELLGEEGAGVSQRVLHCSWASPAYGKVGGREMIVFAGGDGWCYGFAPATQKHEEGYNVLLEYWRYDCNPPEYRRDPEGNPIKYGAYEGPSEVIATPVLHDDKVYVLVGGDPDSGSGVGMLSCIDATQSGDLSGKALWTYKGVRRSMSTPSVAGGLVYVADYSGNVHCVDARTGEAQWVYDTKGHIWASTLVADGRVLIGNQEGELHILAVGRTLKNLGKVEFPAQLLAEVVVANGILYVTTTTHLYAFGQ